MQSPPFPRYLVAPKSKYSPQHHVLKHRQLIDIIIIIIIIIINIYRLYQTMIHCLYWPVILRTYNNLVTLAKHKFKDSLKMVQTHWNMKG